MNLRLAEATQNTLSQKNDRARFFLEYMSDLGMQRRAWCAQSPAFGPYYHRES